MALTLRELKAKRRQILRVLEARGATNPRVFGSVARGTADEASDLDLLVDLREPVPAGFAYFGLLAELQDEIARIVRRPVHVIELTSSSPVADEIRQEARPL
jgi:uncharacterized protein